MGLFRRESAVCIAVRARMEDSVRNASHPDELLAALEPAERDHAVRCANCRHAAGLYAASSQLLVTVRDSRPSPDAWFASHVMRAIAAQESESPAPALAALLPRYASRLAWVASVALLITGSWVYGGAKSPTQPSMNVPESLFETQPGPPQTPDDVLMSLAITEQ